MTKTDLANLMVDEQPAVALEALLRPIPGSDPSGRSLRYDRIYDLIKDARRADDPSAPRDIWSKDLKSADWREVRHLCEEALVRESKDLQVCAWLTEAWLHQEGLKGLRRGVELMLQMAESYWETVHPALTDGVDFRIAPFIWVNEKLPAALGQVVIVSPEDDSENEAYWDDWKRALWLEKVSARRPQDEEIRTEMQSALNLTEFRSRSAKTSESFFKDNLAVLEDAMEATRALEAFLDDRLGQQSPSLVRFREALGEIETWTKLVVREGSFRPDMQGGAAMTDEAEPEVRSSSGVQTAGGPVVQINRGPIADRAEAYRMLLAAAQYLKEVEPHSPTPYLVLKAVSWGGKSLDDLLREFVREGLDLQALFTFLGIEPRNER